jgi:hypothetical protein
MLNVMSGALIGVCLAACQAADAAPAWTWRCPAGIEWVESVGGASRPALLVHSRDARLHVLDAALGAGLLKKPLQTERGLRYANRGQSGGVAYCFDRYTVYALQLAVQIAAPPKLRWRVGDPPERRDVGDPEFLSRIVAAHAVDDGVIIVRLDGRTALLDRRDGRVRWETRLAPLADARIHQSGDAAAILWKTGPSVHAALLDLRRRAPQPAFRQLTDAWPMWSGLIGGKLLAVRPKQVSIFGPGPDERSFRPQDERMILAAALDVLAPAAEANPPLLVFGDSRGGLHALDLASAREAWSILGQGPEHGTWTALRVTDGRFLATGPAVLLAGDARLGRVATSHTFPAGTRVISAVLRGDAACALISKTALDRTRQLALVRIPLERGKPIRTRLVGRDPVSVTGAIWLERRIILVTRDGVAAYALR